MQSKAFECPRHYTTVCVDSCEGHVQKGRLYHPGLQGELPFHGLTQFFLYMEQLLDGETPFPAPVSASRFSSPRSMQQPQGKRATFLVKILFRQNAGWQGSVLWVEKGQEESFRSELELALLMDSALESGE